MAASTQLGRSQRIGSHPTLGDHFFFFVNRWWDLRVGPRQYDVCNNSPSSESRQLATSGLESKSKDGGITRANPPNVTAAIIAW